MSSRPAGAWRLGTATVALAFGLGISGCNAASQSVAVGDPAAESVDPVASPELLTLRGDLVWGHEVRSFRECDAVEASWMVDETGGEVRAIYQQLAPEPYQQLFFEVRGVRGPAVDAGFAADYASSVTVHEVRRAELEGRGCDDDLTAVLYRAAGTEPFWSLEISPAALVLSRPDLPGGTEWPPASPETLDGAIVFRSADQTHGSIAVNLTEKPCTNAMSGARFPLTAEIRFSDETLRGCALEGDLAQR